MHEGVRGRIAGPLLIAGTVCFWLTWALMPMPGSVDPAYILEAVAASRSMVWMSCVVQLASAAMLAAGLVLLPGPPSQRGQTFWWAGIALLAVGMTGNSADAIYHLAAYELTDPGVPVEVALRMMTRLQGPDLILLLPTVGAFLAGLGLFVLAAIEIKLLPRAALLLFAAAVVAAAARFVLPGSASRVAGLLALACAVAPIAWIGWSCGKKWRCRSRLT